MNYSLVLRTQIAKSLVINPASTVFIITSSKVLQKLVNSVLLSNLALCNNPRVHANIEAIEFVEVSLPY